MQFTSFLFMGLFLTFSVSNAFATLNCPAAMQAHGAHGVGPAGAFKYQFLDGVFETSSGTRIEVNVRERIRTADGSDRGLPKKSASVTMSHHSMDDGKTTFVECRNYSSTHYYLFSLSEGAILFDQVSEASVGWGKRRRTYEAIVFRIGSPLEDTEQYLFQIQATTSRGKMSDGVFRIYTFGPRGGRKLQTEIKGGGIEESFAALLAMKEGKRIRGLFEHPYPSIN